jgi:2-amino-4-hydroxy-6-hydroxymethyldihydropteridine diphosphokinase
LDRVFLGLGSNLGDRQNNLKEAAKQIATRCGQISGSSSIYETDPIGYLDQPAFLNQVLKIDTILSPYDLMHECLEIEREMGRVRDVPNGPRIIDIDILTYGRQVIDTDNPIKLKIPHPRMLLRRFVLEPLAEIDPDFIIPSLDQITVSDLLKNLTDSSRVTKLSSDV